MISALLLAFTLLTPQDDAYRWPLDTPRQLTSSFAEFRTGRFHAGIDLRAPVGQPVYAAADGHIARIRCSPYGYGKAVYLQFNDGNSAVYAHLSDFNDALRAYVRNAQHAAKDYSVDLSPGPTLFPIRAGDLLARSGQTGIGAPHLHYELRDKSQQPVNPRALGVQWPDDTPPVIRKIAVFPDGPGSRVNGDILPALLEARPDGPGRYKTAPVRARGRLGFGVDLLDPAAGGAKLGIFRLSLRHGGAELFRMQHDRLSYENHRNAEVAYHPYLKSEGAFLLLLRWPGNVCESYAHTSSDGWWTPPAAETFIEIEAADFNGNIARIAVPVQPDPETNPEIPQSAASATGNADLDCPGDYVVVSIRFNAPEAETPDVTAESPQDIYSLGVFRVDARTFRAGFAPELSGNYTFRASHPRIKPFERTLCALRRGNPAAPIDLGVIQLKAAPDSPYGWIFAAAAAEPVKAPAGLKAIGNAYHIWPEETPIDELLTLSFPIAPVPHQPGKMHVYRKSGTAWARQDAKRTENTFVLTTRRFGTYALMEDTVPPALSGISIEEGLKPASKRPTLSARVSDAGSGIDRADIFCDGVWLLTAYDPENTRMDWEADEDLASGPHKIEFRARDAAGNSVSIVRNITLP